MTRHALCDSVLSYERNRWKCEHVIRNAILSMFYDLRSLHSGTCLNTKTPRAFRWKRAFCTWTSKFTSFLLCFEQANWTRPRKKLGYEVNFLSTANGTVDQCTILTPSPQRHLALIYCPDQASNGQNLNILRGLLWAFKLGLFSLKLLLKGKRCSEIDREANHKWVRSGKVSRWIS